MSFRILDPNPQYRKADGTLCADGTLTFTLTGTSTPADVYADPDLGTNLGNVIDLASDARPSGPLWGDPAVSYRLELKDSLGATVAGYPLDDIQGGDFGGVTIPDPTTGTDGQVLSTDGSEYLFRDVREVPDPSGHDGDMLVVSGTEAIWTSQPEIPSPDIVVAATTFQAGTSDNTSKFYSIQGSDTAPASGTHTTTKAVTFSTAFTTTPWVGISPTAAAAGTGGFLPAFAVIARSTTGFTVKFDTDEGSGSGGDITNPITFDWIAIGRLTVT